jgi:hypothetical protein
MSYSGVTRLWRAVVLPTTTIFLLQAVDDDLTSLANAFTRRGLVKHFWNMNGSEGQPSGPTPPETETELIPKITSR